MDKSRIITLLLALGLVAFGAQAQEGRLLRFENAEQTVDTVRFDSGALTLRYPFENVSYKTLSGETYNPGVPSFDEINALRTATSTKEQKYEALEGLETTVREKMQASIDKINYALAETEAGYTLDDKFYTNGD